MTKEQIDLFKNLSEKEKEEYLMNLIVKDLKKEGGKENGL